MKISPKIRTGFTLIELLIVIALIGIIILAVTKFELDTIAFNENLNGSLTAEQEAENALKTMTKEIKSMQPSVQGAYSLVSASSTAISFYFDANEDGIPDQITYYLSTSSSVMLMRQDISATGSPLIYTPSTAVYSQLAHYVVNASSTPLFTFYDSNYPSTTTPLSSPINVQQVRLVKVNIVIDTDPKKSPNPMTYTTQVSIRGLKSNL